MNFTNIKNINKSELLRLFYPMIAGYLVSLKCNTMKTKILFLFILLTNAI